MNILNSNDILFIIKKLELLGIITLFFFTAYICNAVLILVAESFLFKVKVFYEFSFIGLCDPWVLSFNYSHTLSLEE